MESEYSIDSGRSPFLSREWKVFRLQTASCVVANSSTSGVASQLRRELRRSCVVAWASCVATAGARGQIPDVEDGQGRPYPESATRKQIPDVEGGQGGPYPESGGAAVLGRAGSECQLPCHPLVLNVNCLAHAGDGRRRRPRIKWSQEWSPREAGGGWARLVPGLGPGAVRG